MRLPEPCLSLSSLGLKRANEKVLHCPWFDFLALIVLVAIGIAFIAIKGTALDKESKAYADSAIPAIVTTWSEKELLDRASPEFKKAVTIDQLDGLFHAFATLGRYRSASQPRAIR